MARRVTRPFGVRQVQECITRIGVPGSDYNTRRNILDSLPAGFERVRPIDPGRFCSSIRWRLSRSIRRRQYFYFRRPYFPEADIFHFWNSVADIRRPWVTSFEHSIPLWDTDDRRDILFGIDLARRPACRRLIAFSRAAFNAASAYWHQYLPGTQADELIGKTEVLLPPQQVVRAQKARVNGAPVFAFVGKEFYRKGGLEVLEGLNALYEAGRREWRAVIAGDLSSFGDYASMTDASARKRAIELLNRLGSHVEFHGTTVPYAQVLALLEQADFYLLPTYADTFGYTVLEAQACGAIPVASDVGSLPEVVSPDTGIRIPLAADLDGERLPLSHAARVKRAFADRVVEALKKCLDLTLEARDGLRRAATDQLARNHCPLNHSRRLGQIYEDALAAPGD